MVQDFRLVPRYLLVQTLGLHTQALRKIISPAAGVLRIVGGLLAGSTMQRKPQKEPEMKTTRLLMALPLLVPRLK